MVWKVCVLRRGLLNSDFEPNFDQYCSKNFLSVSPMPLTSCAVSPVTVIDLSLEDGTDCHNQGWLSKKAIYTHF